MGQRQSQTPISSTFRVQKYSYQNNLSSKNIKVQKFWVQKKICVKKKIWVEKKFWAQKNFVLKKIMGQKKNSGSKKNYGPKQISTRPKTLSKVWHGWAL